MSSVAVRIFIRNRVSDCHISYWKVSNLLYIKYYLPSIWQIQHLFPTFIDFSIKTRKPIFLDSRRSSSRDSHISDNYTLRNSTKIPLYVFRLALNFSDVVVTVVPRTRLPILCIFVRKLIWKIEFTYFFACCVHSENMVPRNFPWTLENSQSTRYSVNKIPFNTHDTHVRASYRDCSNTSASHCIVWRIALSTHVKRTIVSTTFPDAVWWQQRARSFFELTPVREWLAGA